MVKLVHACYNKGKRVRNMYEGMRVLSRAHRAQGPLPCIFFIVSLVQN